MTTTIRVSEETRDRFARLAEATGRPMRQLVDDAAEALERQLFFAEASARWDALRADPAVWAEIEAERQIESSSLRDRSA